MDGIPLHIFLFFTYFGIQLQASSTTATLSTTTITTPATTERMADQWANKFEQLGITDDQLNLDERWANLLGDPFLLKSIDDREHEPVKKIEVVF